jgi:hypothetical protein
MLLIFGALLKGEQIYHRATEGVNRSITFAALQAFVIILILILINDMIETDKVGSFFFITLAMLTNSDLKMRQNEA